LQIVAEYVEEMVVAVQVLAFVEIYIAMLLKVRTVPPAHKIAISAPHHLMLAKMLLVEHMEIVQMALVCVRVDGLVLLVTLLSHLQALQSTKQPQ
jgi:hypothetical protein